MTSYFRIRDDIIRIFSTFQKIFTHRTQFYRIKAGGGFGPPPPPPPIIFQWQILLQQTIYRWKGNLTASTIHFKHWKNLLISRFYEQFSQNDSAMAPKRLFENISEFLKYEHITHHFKARGLAISNIFTFAKYWKFRDFMNTLRNFAKHGFAHIFAKVIAYYYIFEISRPSSFKRSRIKDEKKSKKLVQERRMEVLKLKMCNYLNCESDRPIHLACYVKRIWKAKSEHNFGRFAEL